MIPATFTCSGIALIARPERLAEVRRALERLEGVRVHAEDVASGRMVVTQVAADVDGQVEGLRRIQQVPGVLAADLVYHYQDADRGHEA